MVSLHRSIFFSAVERYGSFLMFICSTAALSRLLTPAEFGIYTVVNAVVIVVSASFQEFGGANYLIQKKRLSEEHIRTAFTITFCISAVLALVLLSCSHVFARVFEQGGMKAAIAVSTLNFALTPFSIVISALFRRNMEFGKLAICGLAASATSLGVAIALAMRDYSFLAPVWGTVAGNVALTVLLIGFCKRRSMLRPSFRELRDVLTFSVYSGGVSIVNVLYALAPQFLLARFLDFSAVGLYSNAVAFAKVFDRLVVQVLSPVIMPAVVSRNRRNGDLKRIYLHAMALLSVVHWPFLVFLAIMAEPIVLLWLGAAWIEVVPLARMICIGSLSLFVASLTYPILVAIGSVRDALITSVISLPPSLLVIFLASFVGVKAVAASAMLTLPFQGGVAIYFIARHLDIGLVDVLRATFKSAIVTLSTAGTAALCSAMVECGLLLPLLGVALACISASMSWLLVLALTEHPLLPRLRAIGRALYQIPNPPARTRRDSFG
jgi:O-antigen/teichoic acid export membrane protein